MVLVRLAINRARRELDLDATDLIDDARLSAEQRAAALDAFQTAWAEVKSRFEGEEDWRFAQTKLAGIVRLIARQGIIDSQHLADAALVVFTRHLV
jgi:hypothetical protein